MTAYQQRERLGISLGRSGRDVFILERNRQNRTGCEFKEPSRDAADHDADEPAASLGPDDDEISTYVAGKLGNRMSHTVRRRHLRQRKLHRYSVPLQILNLPLQGRLGSIRTLLSDVDSD